MGDMELRTQQFELHPFILLLLFQVLQQLNKQIIIPNDRARKQWQPLVERLHISKYLEPENKTKTNNIKLNVISGSMAWITRTRWKEQVSCGSTHNMTTKKTITLHLIESDKFMTMNSIIKKTNTIEVKLSISWCSRMSLPEDLVTVDNRFLNNQN